MASYQISELLGDGISAELSKSVHTVISALPVQLDIEPVDLSLEARRKDAKGCYDKALASMKKNRRVAEVSHRDGVGKPQQSSARTLQILGHSPPVLHHSGRADQL